MSFNDDDDEAPPELVDVRDGVVEDEEELTVKVPITIVTGESTIHPWRVHTLDGCWV